MLPSNFKEYNATYGTSQVRLRTLVSHIYNHTNLYMLVQFQASVSANAFAIVIAILVSLVSAVAAIVLVQRSNCDNHLQAIVRTLKPEPHCHS